jgi:tripartite-type tricarboxylate transporter receptor subunit TctC
MAELGSESVGSTPEAYNAAISSEIDKWTRLIKESNIKVE